MNWWVNRWQHIADENASGDKMTQNKFPVGWSEEKVQNVLTHYETQTEDEAVAEDEAAFADETQAIMEIPIELVPLVRKLIAQYRIDHKIPMMNSN